MIEFVTGKGGVGKTDFSKDLLAQYSDGVLASFEKIPGALFLEAKSAIKEYLSLRLKNQKAVNFLLDNKLSQSLLEAAPGIEALVTTGKVYELSKTHNHVVVDSPSTGHFPSWFSSCKFFREMIPLGPIHEDAKKMEEQFFDPQKTQVHIVSLPLRIVLEETLDLVEVCKKEGIPLGKLIMNKVIPDILTPDPRVGTLEELLKKKKEAQENLLKSFPLSFERRLWRL